jgi:leucyl aminopeptidase (aminopeptidase T)
MIVDRAKVEDGILKMLSVNMGIRPGEHLLVVTDVPTPEQWRTWTPSVLSLAVKRSALARIVADTAGDSIMDVEVCFLPFPSTGRNAVEPPQDVAIQMEAADVVVMITSFSLSHTDAREVACRAGARVASMPRFIPEMFCPGSSLDADYGEIMRLTERLTALVTQARRVRVTCPAGTDIHFSIEGRPGLIDAGIYTEPGTWGNLPAGEAYCAPLEGTAEGVVQVSAGWEPDLTVPMTLVFTRGELVELQGGGQAGDTLREILRPGTAQEPYKMRRNLAEFGIGTNPNAKRADVTLEAEKIKGTVHMAVGDNSHMGGRVNTDYHHDFVVPNASFTLDDRIVMRDGQLALPDTH